MSEATREKANVVYDKLVAFIDELPESDNSFIVMLALAWTLGGELGAVPDAYRTRVRDIVNDEMDAVIKTMEKDSMAGSRRMFALN
jgi:hypothetical protein